MADAPDVSAPAEGPPRYTVSAGVIVCIQITLFALASMVIDGGVIVGCVLIATATSWICGLIAVFIGRKRLLPGVLAWSWLASVLLAAAVWTSCGSETAERTAMRRTAISSDVRQLLAGCLAYSSNDPRQMWPSDLPSLFRWSQGNLSEQMLAVAWHPELAQAMVYIHPVGTAPANQLVMLSDPACDAEGTSVACYADGRIALISRAQGAEALWLEANRLAASPQALGDGVRPGDWRAPSADGR